MSTALRALSLLVVVALVSWSGPAWAQDEEAEPEEAAEAEPEAEPLAEPEPEPAPEAEPAPAAAAAAATTAVPAQEAAPLPQGTTTELPSGPEEAMQLLMAGFSMTDAQKAEYAALLRQVVKAVRGKVMDKMSARVEAKQAAKLDKLGLALGIFSLLGALLLFLPLKLKKKYPGQGRLLFKYSALAALLFFLAVNLFASVMFAMRGAQGVLGQQTNPQLKIVDATFDLFDDKAEDLAAIGPALIEPTLASLTGESDEPVVSTLLGNVQRFQSKLTVFQSLASMFKKVDWLFGMLPIILMGVALLLFVKTALPTLKEIARLPERAAASGHEGVARSAVRFTLHNVWAEAKATLGAIGVLLGLTLLAGVVLGFVLQPVLEVFITYLTANLLYVMFDPEASAFWVGFALIATMLFLVLNLAVVVLATAFYMGKAQKSFQAKFREGVPLSAQKGLWTWGSLSAAWSMILPVLYVLVAYKAIGWLFEKALERHLDTENLADSNWGVILGSGPALFLLTFGAVFWAARGGRALGFLARYRIVTPMRAPVPHDQVSDTEPFPRMHAA